MSIKKKKKWIFYINVKCFLNDEFIHESILNNWVGDCKENILLLVSFEFLLEGYANTNKVHSNILYPILIPSYV